MPPAEYVMGNYVDRVEVVDGALHITFRKTEISDAEIDAVGAYIADSARKPR